MITTQTPHPQDLTASTQTSQEVAPRLDAAAQWAATIEALRAYQAECEARDLAQVLDRESAIVDG